MKRRQGTTRKGRGRDKDTATEDLLVFRLIKNVNNALIELMNLIDRMKSHAKCSENIYFYCDDVQSAIELMIQDTTCQAHRIIAFVSTSKKYWNELRESYQSLLRFNNRKLNTTSSASSYHNNHHYYVPKDPNSDFNTIQVDLQTIPMENINESITSRPKTYIYHDLMKNIGEMIRSITPTTVTTFPHSFLPLIRELLDHYEDIIGSNDLNSRLMHEFKIDYEKIQTLPLVNQTSLEDIVNKLNALKRVFSIQLNASCRNVNEIKEGSKEMEEECQTIVKSIEELNILISTQQKSTDDYMKNTVIYWNKLNSFQETMIVKIYNQLQKLLKVNKEEEDGVKITTTPTMMMTTTTINTSKNAGRLTTMF